MKIGLVSVNTSL